MALTRCDKGHFYDSDKYRTCPFCDQTTPNVIQTAAATPNVIPTNAIGGGINPQQDIEPPTTGDFGGYDVKPVMGWLVSIEGSTPGKDFRLCAGRNYIGRDTNMDVVLHDDNAVSRQKHAIVIFDPVSQMTLCQAGESRELFYLNGKVVTDTVELHKGDVLTIGRTKLMFVPFCGELHTWEEK